MVFKEERKERFFLHPVKLYGFYQKLLDKKFKQTMKKLGNNPLPKLY